MPVCDMDVPNEVHRSDGYIPGYLDFLPPCLRRWLKQQHKSLTRSRPASPVVQAQNRYRNPHTWSRPWPGSCNTVFESGPPRLLAEPTESQARAQVSWRARPFQRSMASCALPFLIADLLILQHRSADRYQFLLYHPVTSVFLLILLQHTELITNFHGGKKEIPSDQHCPSVSDRRMLGAWDRHLM